MSPHSRSTTFALFAVERQLSTEPCSSDLWEVLVVESEQTFTSRPACDRNVKQGARIESRPCGIGVRSFIAVRSGAN